MKKQIADMWVDALRSGEFKQGFNNLEKDGANCCLGVLCNLALVEGVCDYDSSRDVSRFDEMSAYLPNSVMEWAGMVSCCGSKVDGETNLVDLNDVAMSSFNEIANAIEKNYEKL